jgi:hypothetical protein
VNERSFRQSAYWRRLRSIGAAGLTVGVGSVRPAFASKFRRECGVPRQFGRARTSIINSSRCLDAVPSVITRTYWRSWRGTWPCREVLRWAA